MMRGLTRRGILMAQQSKAPPSLQLPYTLFSGEFIVGTFRGIMDIPFSLPAGLTFPANIRIVWPEFGYADMYCAVTDKNVWTEGTISLDDVGTVFYVEFYIDDSGMHFSTIQVIYADGTIYDWDTGVELIEVVA